MTDRPRETRPVDMKPKQRDAYTNLAEQIVHNGVNPFHPDDGGVHLEWLSLYASATGALDENKAIILGLPSSKARVVIDLLNNFDGTPTVVFATSAGVLDVVRTALPKPLRKTVASEMHVGRHRGKGVKSFANGTKDTLVTTTHRDIGLTYPRARRAVFLQRPWDKGAIAWIEGALPDDCEIVTYVSAGTIDCFRPHDPNRYHRLIAEAALSGDIQDFLYGKGG